MIHRPAAGRGGSTEEGVCCVSAHRSLSVWESSQRSEYSDRKVMLFPRWALILFQIRERKRLLSSICSTSFTVYISSIIQNRHRKHDVYTLSTFYISRFLRVKNNFYVLTLVEWCNGTLWLHYPLFLVLSELSQQLLVGLLWHLEQHSCSSQDEF